MKNARISPALCAFTCAVLIFLHSPQPIRGDGTVSGADVYTGHCAACHDQGLNQAPPKDALQKMSAARILKTMDFGLMMGIAYPLTRDERNAVAKFLGSAKDEAAFPAAAFCSAGMPVMRDDSSSSWNGWSPSLDNTRFQTVKQAGLTAANIGQLKLKWAFGFPGDVTAFAAPTVFKGTLFVGSAGGAVQAIDVKSGCVHWIFQANGPVRSAILAVPGGTHTSLLFGDQIGWFYSIDAMSGKLAWKRKVDEQEAVRLTGSPVERDGVVFVPAASWEETRSVDSHYPCCTFRGSVTALGVHDGSVVWRSFMVDPPKKTGVNSAGAVQSAPSGAGIWSTPTIDAKRGLLYVTTGDNYSLPATAMSDALVAMEIKTGKIAWWQQTNAGDAYTSACRNRAPNCPAESGPDFDFGSSALLLKSPGGHDILVAGQKSGIVYGFDPDDRGKILWQTRVGKGGTNGGVQWGMASDGHEIYAAVSDLSGFMSLAGPVGGAKLDASQGGGLAALRLEDGQKTWSVPGYPCDPPRPGCSPAQPQAVSMIPGVVFSGSMDGHLRAYDTADGKILWDVDTAKEYETVDGIAAHGGSLDGAGPVIVGGMLFVNSGYPRNGGVPGNVLLAFGVE